MLVGGIALGNPHERNPRIIGEIPQHIAQGGTIESEQLCGLTPQARRGGVSRPVIRVGRVGRRFDNEWRGLLRNGDPSEIQTERSQPEHSEQYRGQFGSHKFHGDLQGKVIHQIGADDTAISNVNIFFNMGFGEFPVTKKRQKVLLAHFPAHLLAESYATMQQ
jgi:hypothetical protein